MSSERQIVFLRDKSSGSFKLRDDLRSFGYDGKRGQYYVVFMNAEKTLYYNMENVDVAKFVRRLEPEFRVIRKKDGVVFENVLGVSYFEGEISKAYRVVYENGTIKDYPSDYLIIEEQIDDARSVNVWDYLKEVAQYNKIPLDDDTTINLASKYAKVRFVAKDSLLEAYLNKDSYKDKTGGKSTPIFPFGCNRSQYKAVRDALDHRISVIQGPPGTGKTQTILNILANLLLDGKTMEIVSNNNSAVENVREKLEVAGLDFICAQLGRAKNKEIFVEGQTGLYPDLSEWKLKDEDKVRSEVVWLSKELQELYGIQEKLARAEEELKEFQRQKDLFPLKVEDRRKWSRELLQKMLYICGRDIEKKHRLSWTTRFRLRWNRLSVNDTIVDELNGLFLSTSIRELEEQCLVYRREIAGLDRKNKRLQDLSMRVLKGFLFKRYGRMTERSLFSLSDITMHTPNFLSEYPIILSTTFSATSNIHTEYKFDYLIMDEASQVDIAAGALALSCARNAVVVGDLKQLPNVIDADMKEIVDAVYVKYGISKAYLYSDHSFLSSLCQLYPHIPQTLLKEHYRCDPLIIGFCSKQFYNGELIPMKPSKGEFAPIRVVRTKKGHHGRGTVNLRQVDLIVQEVIPSLEEHFSDIGVIAPYNEQVSAIKSAMESTGEKHVVATVHKFQGRENDAIVLSTVVNQVNEFVDDPHLLNVAVSRAKKQFTLVVAAEEQPDSNMQNLIDYIEYYQGSEEISTVSSVFDLLYDSYAQERLDFFRTHKRVSDYDSESLIYWKIKEVMEEQGLSHLAIRLHYPMRYLITEATNLTDEQRQYATRSWTHLDFLLYDTVSHKARLAIEVDGTQFHRKGSKQASRDVLKDAVLQAIGLPLLRLRTNESGEEQRIIQALTN